MLGKQRGEIRGYMGNGKEAEKDKERIEGKWKGGRKGKRGDRREGNKRRG